MRCSPRRAAGDAHTGSRTKKSIRTAHGSEALPAEGPRGGRGVGGRRRCGGRGGERAEPIGLGLEVRRVVDRGAIAAGRRHATGALLHDMRELVPEELVAGGCPRRVPPGRSGRSMPGARRTRRSELLRLRLWRAVFEEERSFRCRTHCISC